MIRTVADPGAQAVSSATLATKVLNTLQHEFQVAMALTGRGAFPQFRVDDGKPEVEPGKAKRAISPLGCGPYYLMWPAG